MSIYRDTCLETGTDPAVLRCDTPGHAQVTGDWETAPWRGWDTPARGTSTPGLHPAGLRYCPQCVQEIRKATMDALERDAAWCTAQCQEPAGEWVTAQRAIIAMPRWAAAGPPPREGDQAPDVYGSGLDVSALIAIFDACDGKYGRVHRQPITGRPLPPLPQRVPPPPAIPGETLPAPEPAGGFPVTSQEEEAITGVLEDLTPGGEDFWAEADAREAGRHGHTAPIPALTADGEVPA